MQYTVSERAHIEEFDTYYASCKTLSVKLIKHPMFNKLKLARTFTNEEKIEYMRSVDFSRYVSTVMDSIRLRMIEAINPYDDKDPIVLPDCINDAYKEYKMSLLSEQFVVMQASK